MPGLIEICCTKPQIFNILIREASRFPSWARPVYFDADSLTIAELMTCNLLLFSLLNHCEYAFQTQP